MNNARSAVLTDMQLESKYNESICFLLCVTDVYTKHTQLLLLKNKKDGIITKELQKILQDVDLSSAVRFQIKKCIYQQTSGNSKRMQQYYSTNNQKETC